MKKSPFIIAATGLGVGFFPIAPGTMGALLAAVIYWFGLKWLSPVTYLITIIAFVFLSVWIATNAKNEMGEADPPQVVIDEMAGLFVTMAFHPPIISYLIGGFLLFRLFDIVKPFPIRWIERNLKDGWGIVMDDVFAGVYANIVLWGLGFLIPNWSF